MIHSRPTRRLTLSSGLILALLVPSLALGYTNNAPTAADLVQYGGNAKTCVVQLLNLSPYTISLASKGHLADQTDQNKSTKKSFTFAPVGLPQTIPGVPAEAFTNPSYVNTTTHPYSMAISWEDANGTVLSYELDYTVKQVDTSTGSKADVNLGIFFGRQKATKDLKSSIFPVIVDVLKEGFNVVKLVVEPENPIAWIDAFLGVTELAKGVSEFEKENTAEDKGDKMWVSSYITPAASKNCGSSDTCKPSTRNIGDDAVDAEQAQGIGGDAESQLVVTTQLLRGNEAKAPPDGGAYGALPIVMVTVMPWTVYSAGDLASIPKGNMQASASGTKLQNVLRQRGKAGLHDLNAALKPLKEKQRQTLATASQALRKRQHLDKNQEDLLAELAAAVEKHGNAPKGGHTNVR